MVQPCIVQNAGRKSMEAGMSIHVQDAGDAVRLVLARPPLNVIDLALAKEITAALLGLRGRDALRAVVIAAEGRAFSAGVSIEDHLPGRAEVMIPAFHDVFRALRGLEVATVAVVHGAALGGGCELAGFCDFVIASEEATFGLPEIKLASFPPVAAVHFPTRIGRARTLQLILTGETLDARKAERIGLADVVVPAAELEAAEKETLARLRDKSATALRHARRAVQHGDGFDERLAAAEAIFLGSLMKTEDASEGLYAFLEKRPPSWRDR
jgi:cyclohexa-1,5-dienecarbonyl-CoA hydratase